MSPQRAGVDTLRLLYEVDRVPTGRAATEVAGASWVVDPLPAFGMVAVEGNPADGALWSPEELLAVGAELRGFVDDSLGVRVDRGVSRLDVTVSRPFAPAEGQAFVAAVSGVELPRLEVTRRGRPVRSVWWTGAKSATIKNRVYDEAFKVAGREAFAWVRVEDQRRFPNGRRPPLEVAADSEWHGQLFRRRHEPMRKAVDGVKAATLPVLARALADEVRYGYRDVSEAKQLAGGLVLLAGGLRPSELPRDSAGRRALSRARASLREAGYVVVDDLVEPVEVDLAAELDAALQGFDG